MAEELDRWNRERQNAERRAVDEAREDFASREPLPAILIAWSEHWHRGVVGVAAGRLARDFNRPVILLALDGMTATGSGRSIDGIHLHDFLSPWRDELERFGGHAQAIGMSVAEQHLVKLRTAWEKAAESWQDKVAVRRFEYELELEPRQISPDLMEQLGRFEPHGQGNPSPLIRFRGPLRLPWAPRVFGKGHLSAVATAADGVRIRLLGWGWEERAAALDGEFEALGFLENDRFRGTVVRLVDCRSCPLDKNDATTAHVPAADGAEGRSGRQT